MIWFVLSSSHLSPSWHVAQMTAHPNAKRVDTDEVMLTDSIPPLASVSGCASQNVSTSNWQLWRIDPSKAPLHPTYSRVSPALPTWHPDDLSSPVRLSTVGRRAFPVSGASVWNDLPLHVASAPSLAVLTQRQRDVSVFPFLPRHCHRTRLLLLPFATVWSPAVVAIMNNYSGFQATLKMILMTMMRAQNVWRCFVVEVPQVPAVPGLHVAVVSRNKGGRVLQIAERVRARVPNHSRETAAAARKEGDAERTAANARQNDRRGTDAPFSSFDVSGGFKGGGVAAPILAQIFFPIKGTHMIFIRHYSLQNKTQRKKEGTDRPIDRYIQQQHTLIYSMNKMVKTASRNVHEMSWTFSQTTVHYTQTRHANASSCTVRIMID